MYLIRFLANFAVFRMFLWIPRDFTGLPEFSGSVNTLIWESLILWAASFTLYKLATKNLHLATIFLGNLRIFFILSPSNYDEDRNFYNAGLRSCSLETRMPFCAKTDMLGIYMLVGFHKFRDFGSLQFFVEHNLATSLQINFDIYSYSNTLHIKLLYFT